MINPLPFHGSLKIFPIKQLVSSSKDLDEDLIAVNAQNIPEVTEDQQQRVNQLMEEAMQDCIRDTPNRTFEIISFCSQ